MGFFSRFLRLEKDAAPEEIHVEVEEPRSYYQPSFVASTNPTDLSTDSFASPGFHQFLWDGEKFPGGYGATLDIYTDYETLRDRSNELYRKNLHARGLVRRRIDNVIATGMKLESTPDIATLGISEEASSQWTAAVERQFELWASRPELCDVRQRRTLTELQQEIQREADLEGDVLVILRWNRKYQLPAVDFIRGSLIQTPLKDKPQKGHKIVRGIEVDAQQRQVAFWVYQEDGTYKRLPAVGEKSGRKLAWIYHGGDNRAEDVRGTPFLTLVMQTAKEIDRYVAAVQRKAVINSTVAATVQRDVESTAAPRPIALMSSPNGPHKVETASAAGPQIFGRLQHILPGTIIDRLAPGEKLAPFSTNGSIEPIDSFVNSHLKHMASANGMSPEVYLMEFNKSFSAAQAANNEQRLALTVMRERFSTKVLTPIYEEWLYASALNGKVDGAALLEASFDPEQYDKYLAWIKCEWAGHVKPVVDIGKVVPAYATMVDRGWVTNERVCRELTGMKFDDVQVRLAKENLLILKNNKPLAELGLIKGAPIAKPEPEEKPAKASPAAA